jgi:integrase
MKISIILDKRVRRANGYPVTFRFTKGNKSVYRATGFYAEPSEFSPQTFFAGNDRKYRYYNEQLTNDLNKVEDLLKDLRMRGEVITPEQFKQLLYDERPDIYSYFQKFIREKSGKTAEVYQMTFNKLKKFDDKVRYFEEINFAFLKRFEKSMIDTGLKTNSIGINFRNIRAVFNQAINEGLVSLSNYPFRAFKIRKGATMKRAISIETLQKIFNYSGNLYENRSRDIATLIFCLIGINVKDLFLLSPVQEDRINYYRAKTSTPMSIKVEPEAQKIIDLYRGDKYLLSFVEHYSDHKTFNKKINLHLKRIAEKLNIPPITTYTLRHTWATIAADLDIPKETIGAALGHSQGSSVTDIYIRFNNRKVDDANRKVLDFVFKGID